MILMPFDSLFLGDFALFRAFSSLPVVIIRVFRFSFRSVQAKEGPGAPPLRVFQVQMQNTLLSVLPIVEAFLQTIPLT